MNKIDGKTLDEILNPQPVITQEYEISDNYDNCAVSNTSRNPSLDMANSLADNMTSNLLFLAILAGNKIKL